MPDFTIVASNSLVGKDYSDIPESSMIGGIPAKLIATGFRKVENSKIECQSKPLIIEKILMDCIICLKMKRWIIVLL